MTVYHTAAILVPWAIWVAYWIGASSGTKRTVRRENRWSRALQAIPMMVGSALVLIPDTVVPMPAAGHARFDIGQLAGILLIVAGLAFSAWARVHLGANWSATATLKAGHELIRTGPYALVRHPIYSGCLLAVAGSAIVNGDWRGVLGFVLIFASLAYKLCVEERWLSDYFGEPYRAYRREVHALVPRIYRSTLSR
jgi:protein-S-isoprenylcysteine O-methyltransferase Ste14